VQRKHILVDACVAAAAFAPKTTRSAQLVRRAQTLLEGTSSSYETQFVIPSFCIAETFVTLEKYRWGATWNKHVSKQTRLTPRAFKKARDAFHEAIHNGTKLLQIELNRYHVLCLDLISPINAAYRIKRDRGAKKNVTPASTYDLLLVAMGIWLQRQLGARNLIIATGDERVALAVRRARSTKLARPMRLHVGSVAARIGVPYSADLYPPVIDLVHAKASDIEIALPDWSPTW